MTDEAFDRAKRIVTACCLVLSFATGAVLQLSTNVQEYREAQQERDRQREQAHVQEDVTERPHTRLVPAKNAPETFVAELAAKRHARSPKATPTPTPTPAVGIPGAPEPPVWISPCGVIDLLCGGPL